MPLLRSHATAAAKGRPRPAGPHCRGGASSLLRLAKPAAPRLPKPIDLSQWMARAASVVAGPQPTPPAFAASEWSR